MTKTLDRLARTAGEQGLTATVNTDEMPGGVPTVALKVAADADPMGSYVYVVALFSDRTQRWTHTAFYAPRRAADLKRIALRQVASHLASFASTQRALTGSRKLVAYEVVNRADPAMVDTIELGPTGDPDGRCLDGLLRQMNVNEWYVQNRYSDGSTS